MTSPPFPAPPAEKQREPEEPTILSEASALQGNLNDS